MKNKEIAFFEFEKLVSASSIIYLGLPFCIFLLGWVRPVLAFPLFVLVGLAVFLAIRDDFSFGNSFLINISNFVLFKLIAVWCIILIWVLSSGIGRFVFQNTDHIWRNTIFSILVNHEWPVVCDISVDGGVQSRGLVYYIGFWLPAALIGKLTSIRIGNLFQVIWASVGVFFVYCQICIYRRKIELWPLFLFIFFSTIDILGWLFGVLCWNKELSIGMHIEWWYKFQYSSITTQLFWVFNQAIPAWLCFLAVLNSKNNRSIVLFLGFLLICSPFPFVGILPYALYVCISRKYGSRFLSAGYFREFLKDTFTFQNFFGGGVSGIITFLYFLNNDSGQSVGAPNNTTRFINDYLMFIAIEVLLFIIVLFFFYKRDPIYYLTCMLLLLFPFARIGGGGDFCMRASIPALMMLSLLCMGALDNHSLKAARFSLIVILSLGAVTPMTEFSRTVLNTVALERGNRDYLYYLPGGVAELQEYLGVSGYMEEIPEEMIMTGGNFSGNAERSLFFRHIARH